MSTKTSEPPAQGGIVGAAVPRALHERLRELGINSSGLPPQVLACLRVVVEAEVGRIQRDLVKAVAALQQRADERIARQITRAVTLKSVGQAFATAAAATKDAKAKPASSSAAEGGAS